MHSPYQLILLNLAHIQAVLLGIAHVLRVSRPFAEWGPALLDWRSEQEKQLRVLIVLYKQVGGVYGKMHQAMLALAVVVGVASGAFLAFLPTRALRVFVGRLNNGLTGGLERAGHQIAIADWAEWSNPYSNPPRTLAELASARREWLSRLATRQAGQRSAARFL